MGRGELSGQPLGGTPAQIFGGVGGEGQQGLLSL